MLPVALLQHTDNAHNPGKKEESSVSPVIMQLSAQEDTDILPSKFDPVEHRVLKSNQTHLQVQVTS
jgi:hypothetical protein